MKLVTRCVAPLRLKWHGRNGRTYLIQEEEDEEDAFRPETGNVAFASAGDGWAFTVGQFATLYAAKMGGNPAALQRVRPICVT